MKRPGSHFRQEMPFWPYSHALKLWGLSNLPGNFFFFKLRWLKPHVPGFQGLASKLFTKISSKDFNLRPYRGTSVCGRKKLSIGKPPWIAPMFVSRIMHECNFAIPLKLFQLLGCSKLKKKNLVQNKPVLPVPERALNLRSFELHDNTRRRREDSTI